MAWDEWEQLKTDAAERQSTQMRLNQVDGGGSAAPPLPGKTGDLKVEDADLTKIGSHAKTLYDDLWNKARVADSSSSKAAGDLLGQGFSLGSGLQHVADRWGAQLKSLLDACAHISNHMQVTKQLRKEGSRLYGRRGHPTPTGLGRLRVGENAPQNTSYVRSRCGGGPTSGGRLCRRPSTLQRKG
ncbi:hypothetical protein [Streptomyces sp. NPDC016845]|uniref:hypothetical protein n=1 Tax=Streptomyces sp. NPDC016845 TaxID=3364972 RepID=UPI00378D047B